MVTKEKVIAYIFRIKNLNKELLVFEHHHMPDAGIQVVGGTVELGENLKQALIREIFEEAGLLFDEREIEEIGKTTYQRKDREEINLRTYFKINGEKLPDKFSHLVQSDGEDNGLIFNYFWINFEDAERILTGNFYELLDQLHVDTFR